VRVLAVSDQTGLISVIEFVKYGFKCTIHVDKIFFWQNFDKFKNTHPDHPMWSRPYYMGITIT